MNEEGKRGGSRACEPQAPPVKLAQPAKGRATALDPACPFFLLLRSCLLHHVPPPRPYSLLAPSIPLRCSPCPFPLILSLPSYRAPLPLFLMYPSFPLSYSFPSSSLIHPGPSALAGRLPPLASSCILLLRLHHLPRHHRGIQALPVLFGRLRDGSRILPNGPKRVLCRREFGP